VDLFDLENLSVQLFKNSRACYRKSSLYTHSATAWHWFLSSSTWNQFTTFSYQDNKMHFNFILPLRLEIPIYPFSYQRFPRNSRLCDVFYMPLQFRSTWFLFILRLNIWWKKNIFNHSVCTSVRPTVTFSLLGPESLLIILFYTESFILIYGCRDPTGTKPWVVMEEFTSGGFPLPSAVYDSIHPDRTVRAL
jgi:hypothetical protein